MQSVTQRWLRQNAHLYSNPDRVCSDIETVIAHFNLRPKSAWHTFDDGRTQLLLCVHGLLPITFKNASYNIPINVWLTRDYPSHPPIAYVVPTSDMLVQPGKYLDVSGRCNIEYMQQWERKNEGCSLLALLQSMQDLFSRQPPVYSKPKNNLMMASSTPPIGVSSIPTRSPPPPPSQGTPSTSMAPATASVSSTTIPDHPPPALPPKPGSAISSPASNHNVVYSPSVTSQSMVINNPQLSESHRVISVPSASSPPPVHPSDSSLPQYHRAQPTYESIPPTYRPSNTVPETTNAFIHVANSPHQYWVTSPSSNSTYVPHPLPPVPPLPPHLPPHSSSTHYAQSPSQPFPLPLQQPPPSPAIIPPPPPLQPSIPPPNLLDEDDDVTSITTTHETPSANPIASPPPRPPNPELLRLHAQVHQKLTSEVASLEQALSLDAERLRAHQNDLLSGEPAIRDEMARLEAVRDVCKNVSGRLRDSVHHVERNVAELRRKGDPEVDELVCSTTIVHNQLINLVAEDNAIEDTIYHLHRALNSGRIDLDRFLRTTRILAEEQFMKRALIEKIQNGVPMGISVGSSWS